MIAPFITNESLGIAQLYHLMDDQPPSTNGILPGRTVEMLSLYIRSLFSDVGWINTVTVPAVVESMDGHFGLSVTGDDSSTVKLADAGHRPHSSRKWR